MTAERRTRTRSPREVSGPREYPKAPPGTNVLLKPLAGSTFGQFNESNAGQNFIMVQEEIEQECEGGTCVEISAQLTSDDGLIILQVHITGDDQVRGWSGWKRLNVPTPQGKIERVELEPGLKMLFDRLADHGIIQEENPTSTP